MTGSDFDFENMKRKQNDVFGEDEQWEALISRSRRGDRSGWIWLTWARFGEHKTYNNVVNLFQLSLSLPERSLSWSPAPVSLFRFTQFSTQTQMLYCSHSNSPLHTTKWATCYFRFAVCIVLRKYPVEVKRVFLFWILPLTEAHTCEKLWLLKERKNDVALTLVKHTQTQTVSHIQKQPYTTPQITNHY